MCCLGDIIIIDKYKHGDVDISKHSFVVIDDESGEIHGFPYDFVANVLSSFKGKDQKRHKLSYPGNFAISHNDTVTNPHNNKDGYIKADQLYYFNKDKISYTVVRSINVESFNKLMEYIEKSDFDLLDITDNL